jgi:hypothetical protein
VRPDAELAAVVVLDLEPAPVAVPVPAVAEVAELEVADVREPALVVAARVDAPLAPALVPTPVLAPAPAVRDLGDLLRARNTSHRPVPT